MKTTLYLVKTYIRFPGNRMWDPSETRTLDMTQAFRTREQALRFSEEAKQKHYDEYLQTEIIEIELND